MSTVHGRKHALFASALLILAGCRGSASTPAQNEPGSNESGAPEAALPAPTKPIEPRSVLHTVPAGTVLDLELLDTLASNSSESGDRVRARVAHDVVVGGAVAIPAGSTVTGVVTEAVGLKKIGGRPELGVLFTTLDPPSGPASDLHAAYHAVGKSETKKDAATIGGAAAGGALLGRILGHKQGNEARGTVVGGVVGAAAGTAVAAGTKGHEIVLPAGHVLQVTLSNAMQVTLRS